MNRVEPETTRFDHEFVDFCQIKQINVNTSYWVTDIHTALRSVMIIIVQLIRRQFILAGATANSSDVYLFPTYCLKMTPPQQFGRPPLTVNKRPAPGQSRKLHCDGLHSVADIIGCSSESPRQAL